MADNPNLPFYTIYQFMHQDLHLHGAEKEVFAIIYGFARSHAGIAEVSITRIQILSGLSRETVTKSLIALKERNLIKYLDEKGKRNANKYAITAPCPSPTSQKTGLVRNSDQSDKLTSHQSTKSTSTSQKNRLQYNKYDHSSINTQLEISGEGKKKFNGKTTL